MDGGILGDGGGGVKGDVAAAAMANGGGRRIAVHRLGEREPAMLSPALYRFAVLEEGFVDGPGGDAIFFHDEFGGVLGEVEAAEIFAEVEVAVLEGPFGECGQVAVGVIGEDGIGEVEEVDAAAELTGAGFRRPMRAFGDDAEEAVVAGEEGEDLRGFAVLGFAEAEAAVRGQGHIGIIGGRFTAEAQRRGEEGVDADDADDED